MPNRRRSKQFMGERLRKESEGADINIDNRSENIRELLNKAVEEWKAQYDSEIMALKMEVEEVKKSQVLINAEYESLKVKCNELMVVNKKQKEEINQLKDQSKAIELQNEKEQEKVDSLEQYGRRLNLEIVGVPFKEEENTNQIVVEVAKLLHVPLSSEQISTSHRLQTRSKLNNRKTDASPPIIVRFLSRDVRNQFFANRKFARSANLKDFFVKGTEKLFVNENLTQSRKKLFWQVKQKAKANNYKYYWTVNGNIYVRNSSESDPLLIKNVNDLSKIK